MDKVILPYFNSALARSMVALFGAVSVFRLKKCFFLVLMCSCALVSLGYAQDITFQAEVSTTNVALGDYIRLTLTATGSQGIQPPEIPEIDGLQFQFIGPSTRVSIINGKHSSSYAFIYNLYPTKTGTFVIPSIPVNINGKEYVTKPVTITVSASGSVEKDQKTAQQSLEQALEERIFITLDTPKKEIYVNEKVPIFIRLYISGISVRNIEVPQLEYSGFLIDEFNEHRQYEQVVNGMRYTVVEFSTSVYPVRSGQLVLGPVRQKIEMLFRNAESSRRSGGFGFFDDDFFQGFLNPYTTQVVDIQSKPLVINVQPLPSEGKPESFTGAVGKFTFNVSVSPRQVKVGDPVTVRMKVAGTGSLKTFDLKGYGSGSEFRVYDAQIKEENNVKILEQVLIPQRKGTILVPEKEFSFFDTEQKQYRTISWGPTELTVDPLGQEEGFRMIGVIDPSIDPARREVFGKDIAFIKNRLGKMYLLNDGFFKAAAFVTSLFVVLILWGAGASFFYFTYRLKTDQRFARRLKAPHYARSGLKNAKSLLEKNSSVAFYDELFKTLQQYFAHKFHIPPGAVNAEEIVRQLSGKKDVGSIIMSVRHIFEQFEAARYAAAGFDQKMMIEDYKKTVEIIDWTERRF